MSPDKLSKANILAALDRLNELLHEKGVMGELCIFGGAAMVLAFDARESTRDVDGVFVPKSEIYQAAEQIAEDLNIPSTWLNDAVKDFVSGEGDLTEEGMPQWGNLHIVRPTTRYLLAMKCIASRIADYNTVGDKNDIIHLCRELRIETTAEILNLVEDYYPTARIQVKTQYFIEEIVEEMKGTSS